MTTTKPFILYLKLSKDDHLKKDLCVLKSFNYDDFSNENQSHNNTANNSCWFALSITRNNANFHRCLWQFTFNSSFVIDSMSLSKKTQYDFNWKDYLHLLIINNQ